MKVSVSFIKSKLKEQETVMKIAESKADYIHVDIMDGKFVSTKNYTFKDIYKFVSGISKPLDVHLMCEKPEKYVRNFAMLNTEFITFHLEAVSDVDKMIDIIHSYGIKCGISIKPETEVTLLEPYLDKEVSVFGTLVLKENNAYLFKSIYIDGKVIDHLWVYDIEEILNIGKTYELNGTVRIYTKKVDEKSMKDYGIKINKIKEI